MSQYCETWVPFGTTLAIITKKYFGALGAAINDMPIDRYYTILLFLENKQHPVSQQCIADYFLIDKTQMVRIMDFLISNTLISKAINPTNRREYLVSLTQKAKAILPQLKKAINETHNVLFEGFSESEKTTFFEQLSKISNNLNGLNKVSMSMQLIPVKPKP